MKNKKTDLLWGIILFAKQKISNFFAISQFSLKKPCLLTDHSLHFCFSKLAQFIKERLIPFLRKISAGLAIISPIRYIFIFVLLVFGYSLIYYCLPVDSFYHSTAMYEYNYLDEDAKTILSSIRSSIVETFNHYYDANIVDFNGWKANITDLKVTSLDLNDYPDSIGFSVTLPVVFSSSDRNQIHSNIMANISISMEPYYLLDNKIYAFLKVDKDLVPMKILGISPIPSAIELFYNNDSTYFPNATPLFSVPLDLWIKIMDFGDGYLGFPKNGSGQYIRMLYLSAGLATSSAFGDIVPIKPLSRLLVLSEAIMSLIIIGLFLNSLANVIAETKTKHLQ